MHILIVDDERMIRTIMSSMLEDVDSVSTISTASTPEEAKGIIAKSGPDIVFLDLTLIEKLDGLELLKDIKKNTPSIKVPIISSDVNIETVRKILSAGAEAYIKKPFSKNHIARVVEKLTEKK